MFSSAESPGIGVVAHQATVLDGNAVHGANGVGRLVQRVQVGQYLLLVGHGDVETTYPLVFHPLAQSLQRGHLAERIDMVNESEPGKKALEPLLGIGMSQTPANQCKSLHNRMQKY